MNIEQKVNLHNRFDIEVRDAVTGDLKQEATAYNIVLDQMYTRLCGGSTYFVNIHFGTGAGTVVATRTSLFTHLGTKTAVNEELIKAIPVSSWKRKIVLNPEEYVGSTITEVGIAFGATATNLVTHAMLKDAEGNPISITKTDTDVITIFATVFVTADVSNPNILYAEAERNALIAYLIGGATWPAGQLLLKEARNAYQSLGALNISWVSDTANKQRKTNLPRFGISDGNGHVRTLGFTNLFDATFPITGVFTGQSYAGVPIATGDGVTTRFLLPSRNIREPSVAIKVAGSAVTADTSVLKRYVSQYGPAISLNASSVSSGPSISGDGNLLFLDMVNAPFVGLFERQGDYWVRRMDAAYLSPGRMSGIISKNGLCIAFRENADSKLKIFNYVDGVWVPRVAPVNVAVSQYAMSADGSVLAVTKADATRNAVYDWDGSAWVMRPTTGFPPGTGGFVHLSDDGNTFAINDNATSPYHWVFDWTGSTWVSRGLPSASLRYADQALSGNGLVYGRYVTGNISIGEWNGSAWLTRPMTVAASTYSGISFNEDGSILAITNQYGSTIRAHKWVDEQWVDISPYTDAAYPGSNVRVSADASVLVANTSSSTPTLRVFTNDKVWQTYVEIEVPPAIGDVITADYIVDGVHKTDQYVIDASFAIQFGEGV
jgi:hypothetical protein